jgi:hypothetical protein
MAWISSGVAERERRRSLVAARHARCPDSTPGCRSPIIGGNSKQRAGDAMSRWLWALLGGVVLLAIAAVFWSAGNRTNVTLPVSQAPVPVAPAPVPPGPVAQKPAPPPAPAPAPSVQQAAPTPPPSLAPPAAQEAAAPPAPAPIPTPAPAPTPALAPTPDAGQQAAAPPAPAPSAEKPVVPPVVAQEPPPLPAAPAPLAETPAPPPAPGGAEPEAQGHYAPEGLAQLVGAWAYSAEDCDKIFQRRGGGWAYRQPIDKFAQAVIVESPKKILLPSATCQIDGATQVEGALKVSAECADSISFTSRSTVIMLRSATELAYSASGDPVLATTLKKCGS